MGFQRNRSERTTGRRETGAHSGSSIVFYPREYAVVEAWKRGGAGVCSGMLRLRSHGAGLLAFDTLRESVGRFGPIGTLLVALGKNTQPQLFPT